MAEGAVDRWPKGMLLPELEQARVLTFGYDASVVDLRLKIFNNRIGDHSMNLLATVATYPEHDNTNNRSIIFAAHSLGGLVFLEASSNQARS